jgi:hypothetical protein
LEDRAEALGRVTIASEAKCSPLPRGILDSKEEQEMKKYAAAFVVALVAGSVFASDITQVNSFRLEGRNFGDFSSTGANPSTMQYGPAGGPYVAAPGIQFNAGVSPSSAGLQIIENFPAGIGGGDNHVGYLSSDGGASRFQVWGGGEGSGGQSFSLTTTITMTGTQTAPRKEGGLKINNPRHNHDPFFIDQGLVLVASDGEVAVFGAAMPFTGMGANVYTFGTTATINFEYYAPGVADPILGGYRLRFTDAVTGLHDSGVKLWGASEPDGIKGFNGGTEIGLQFQGFNNLIAADGINIAYGGVNLVPAPSALALLGLGGLVATRRRR